MENKIDESLYSRQLYVYGKESMQTLNQSKVLISNINGLGLEIAKCIILAGVKKVMLHDVNLTQYQDLTTNYYLTQEDINKNRALSCCKKLQELNPYVEVLVNAQDILLNQEELLKNFNTLVLCDYPQETIKRINQMTRKNNIKLITCSTYGLVGQVFCDFNKFITKDQDGEAIKSGIILDVRESKKGSIIKTAQNHKLSYGDIIKIISQDLNSQEVKVLNIHSSIEFEVETKFSELQKSKSYEQIKVPKEYIFQSYEDEMKSPRFVHTDFNSNKTILLHTYYLALHEFYEKYKTYPKTKSIEDKNKIISFMKEFNKNIKYEKEDIDKMITKLTWTSNGKVCPLDSVIGSMVAQEVIKSCMNKYTPLFQTLYFESLDSLQENYLELDESEFYVKNTRYENQVRVFGKSFQNQLNNSKVFIVGSGAIGCEHLKNFAMIGVGNLVITDMDTIERSNLNRQFLFRPSHIGKSKSLMASQEIQKINPEIKVEAHENRVGHETLHIYNDKFFKSLDCVTNALDNINARLFMDSLCVNYTKPLLESGTLGTTGNVQSIIPHLTESYGSQMDPPEETVPMCTIKNFPYMPEHCIQWSRELFEEVFTQRIKNLNKYLENPEIIKELAPAELLSLGNDVIKMSQNMSKTLEDYIKFAYNLWHELFVLSIEELTKKYPKDYEQEGVKFWSGTKKYPNHITFNAKNNSHLSFIATVAKLWSEVHGEKIEYNTFMEKIKLESSVKIDIKTDKNIYIEELSDLLKSIPDKKVFSGYKFSVIEFEKDDDTNYHIDFITHATNMRSSIYDIKQLDRLSIKGIAGKIIPAIATTTSLVSGLVTLELYKVLNKKQKLEDYRNYYVNIGLASYQYTEPVNVNKQKVKSLTYTLWDTFEFEDMEMGKLIDYFKNKYNLEVTGFMADKVTLLSEYLPEYKQRERKNKKFSEVYEEIMETKSPKPLMITMVVEEDEEDYSEEFPTIKIK
jgi:ubiquitin-activating enzyme E1